MSSNYQIPEVSGELVADVAKTLANSSAPMSLIQLINCYVGQFGDEYVRRAAIAGVQLGMIQGTSVAYSCVESQKSLLKKVSKSELHIPFQAALQNYGPFLMYADYLGKHYGSLSAATRARGLFQIQISPEKVEKTLRQWGKYSELIEENGQELRIKVKVDNLLFDYAKRLVEALEAELQAKLFTIDMLGAEVFAYLDSNNIKLDDLAKALRNYESDSKPSAARSLELYERFVHTLANQKGVNVQKPTGLMNWVDGFERKDLPSNLLHVCHGMVGIRNMSHHNPDVETGKPWAISKQAALTSTLLVPIVIRSMFLSISKAEYEF
jgi:hypothetical protein